MKVSQVLMIIFLIVVGITIFSFIKNEKTATSLIASIKQGKMSINAYRDYTSPDQVGVANFAFSANHSNVVELVRKERNNKILSTGGGFLAVIFVVFIVVKSYENKKDPIKNLDNLKQNKIISESEYQEKIEHSKEVENNNKRIESKKREYKKLVSELNNLKEKGILTEDEYQQKLIKITEKTA